MINQIGKSAGVVWKYLTEHPEAKPSEIKKTLKLSDDLLWMAIGWLAREGKVVFSQEGKAMRVSLTTQ